MALIRSSRIVYRVFQRRAEPGLCCAVPQAMPIPYFVRPDAWNFGCALSDDDSLPVGFQPLPAREASAAFGYYLFHDPCEALSPRRRRAVAAPPPDRWIRPFGDGERRALRA